MPTPTSARQGMGYNSISGRWANLALVSPIEVQIETKNHWTGFVYLVETHEQFSSLFSIDAGASFEGFGAEADFSYNLVKWFEIDFLSLTLVAIQDVFTRDEFLTTKTLSQTTLAEINDPSFLRHYGDSFCDTISYGGRLCIIARFRTKSLQQKTTLSSSLSFSVGVFSSALELQQKFSHFASSIEFELFVSSQGSIPQSVGSWNEAYALVTSFPNTIYLNGGVARQHVNIPYEYALGYTTLPPTLGNQKERLTICAEVHEQAVSLSGYWAYVAHHPHEFIAAVPSQAQNNANECNGIAEKAQKQAKTIVAHPFDALAEEAPSVPELLKSVPKFNPAPAIDVIYCGRTNAGYSICASQWNTLDHPVDHYFSGIRIDTQSGAVRVQVNVGFTQIWWGPVIITKTYQQSNWHDASSWYGWNAGKIYYPTALACRVVGEQSGFYDIEYELEMNDGQPGVLKRNGEWVGHNDVSDHTWRTFRIRVVPKSVL